MVEEILPSVNRQSAEDLALYVRPLRSRLHAALTLPVEQGGLIVIDDAVHDLTISVARWITASTAAFDGESTEMEIHPAVPTNDAVRVLRAELGSVRWNGALWQPVVTRLSKESRLVAAILGDLAMKFVLAHEIGHLVLGHLRREPGGPGGIRSREHDADAFAARVLQGHLRERLGGEDSDVGEIDAIARSAIRVALGTLEAVSAAFLVCGDEHPPPAERFRAACEAGCLAEGGAIERPAELFFDRLERLVLCGEPSLVDLVDHSASMWLARSYDAAECSELNRIDRIETLFHAPLPTLLEALADLALPPGELRPPPEVLAAARSADALNAGGSLPPLPESTWIRIAAGRWWLLDHLLEERGPADVEATLQPIPGNRFCEWAGWVEHSCPEQIRGVVLAALHVYATAGPRPEGSELTAAGLDVAVGAWLSPKFGADTVI
jgi:hypothetical protein